MRIIAALTVLGLAQDVRPPSKEHALPRSFVGEWEGKVERAGIERGRHGGFWVVLELRGCRPYEGHGPLGYAPAKKKYAGVWAGSAAPGLGALEGEADPSGTTLTMWIDCPHPKTGEMVKERMVHAFAGPSGRTLTFYGRAAVMTRTLKAGKTP